MLIFKLNNKNWYLVEFVIQGSIYHNSIFFFFWCYYSLHQTLIIFIVNIWLTVRGYVSSDQSPLETHLCCVSPSISLKSLNSVHLLYGLAFSQSSPALSRLFIFKFWRPWKNSSIKMRVLPIYIFGLNKIK
jgi:hypothetical protein